MTALLPVSDIDDLIELDSGPSTQEEARRQLGIAAADGERHTIVVAAQRQLAGLGREGRRWVDPPGESLLMTVASIGARPSGVLEDLPRLVVCGIQRALAMQAPRAADHLAWKAPNDLVDAQSGAKVCGVLIDARTVGEQVEWILVGIGINLDTDPFVLDDGRRATSVRASCGQGVARAQLLRDLGGHVAWLLTNATLDQP